MRYVAFSGGKLNACAADLFLLPVLFSLRGRWMRSGALGYWLFALWMITLLSWTLSISDLTLNAFLRESIKVATCYLYALVGFGIGRGLKSEKSFIRGSAFAAVPMAAIGIFAFFTGTPRFFLIETRVAGTLGDANAFGIYLAMMLPLVASLRVAWLAIPLFVGATVVSFSRTGLVEVSSSLALSLRNLGLRRYLLVLLGCAVVFAGVWGVASNTVVGKRVTDYGDSLETRQGLWRLAAEVGAEHPLLGIGRGNWKAVSGRGTIPHNTFLSVLVNTGLIGLAVFVLPLAVWLWRGIRRPQARRWAIAVLVGMVGGLAVSLDNFRPFWLAVGALVAVLAGARDDAAGSAVMRGRVHAPRERHWN
jgi:O-antigen ligase